MSRIGRCPALGRSPARKEGEKETQKRRNEIYTKLEEERGYEERKQQKFRPYQQIS